MLPARSYLLLFTALVLTGTGCDVGQEDYFGTLKPKHGPAELWLNNGGEPQWIDPGKCSDSNGGDVIWNTFAGLVEAHPESLEPMPEIATHWEVSEDGRTYTFHLRESKWSDGTPLTAHDFEWSWKRLLDPATASKYAYIAYPLKNAEPYNLRAILVQGVEGEEGENAIRELLEDIPIESLELSTNLNGTLVVVGGEKDERRPNRDRALELLNEAQIGDSDITADVVDRDAVGVRALDDFTLEIQLRDPIPYVLHLLSFYSFMPVPRHVIERLEEEGKHKDLWTRPEHIVSNGAYVLREWKFRQHMIFEKNENYWNAAIVRTPRVKATMVESYNTALNMYRAGEMDFPGGNTSLPAEFMDTLKQYKDYRYDPYLAAYFYWFNTKNPPLDKLEVRQALTLAVDRQAIVDHVTRANQIPTGDLVPNGLAGYQGLGRSVFDPEEAQRLLAEAGYPGGEGFPEVTLIYNTSEGHKQIAEAVQQMWKKNLGIQIQIENLEWKVYLEKLEKMDFQIARMGWIGDYPDPYTFLDLLLPSSGNNHSHWADQSYVEMLKAANREQNAEKRLAKLRDAEAHALSVQPLMPIYVYTRSQMIKPYIKGLWGNFLDRHLWKYIWIDDRWYEGVPDAPIQDDPPPEYSRSDSV